MNKELSPYQYFGTNMFIIYNKLPFPVQTYFVKYMKHPISNILNYNYNISLKNVKCKFNIYDVLIIDRIKKLKTYIYEIKNLISNT